MMSSPSVFFADTGIPVDKKKTTPGKLPENPLMLRPPPSFSTETAVVPHASVNDSSFSGLRQRRPLEPKTTNAVASPFLPPKSSLSLQTGSLLDKPRSQLAVPRKIEKSLLSENKGCWVIVFGIATDEHKRLVLDYLKTIGSVIDTRGSILSGRRNWMALKFKNKLEAEHACGQHSLELTPGIVFGVERLNDNDPKLAENPAIGLGDISTSDSLSLKRKLLEPDAGITENDILLHDRDSNDETKKRSCLERFLCWVLRIED